VGGEKIRRKKLSPHPIRFPRSPYQLGSPLIERKGKTTYRNLPMRGPNPVGELYWFLGGKHPRGKGKKLLGKNQIQPTNLAGEMALLIAEVRREGVKGGKRSEGGYSKN